MVGLANIQAPNHLKRDSTPGEQIDRTSGDGGGSDGDGGGSDGDGGGGGVGGVGDGGGTVTCVVVCLTACCGGIRDPHSIQRACNSLPWSNKRSNQTAGSHPPLGSGACSHHRSPHPVRDEHC